VKDTLLTIRNAAGLANCLKKNAKLGSSFKPHNIRKTPKKTKMGVSANELHVEGYGPDKGHLPLSKLRAAGEVVKLHGVGGAMLLVRAELHREGLMFPTFPYKHRIETEGLAMLARDIGYQSWGMPNVEAIHL